MYRAQNSDRSAVAGDGPRSERWRQWIRGTVAAPANAHIRSIRKRNEVRAVMLRPELQNAAVVAILVIKDEAPRLPFFLSYHRGLGVEHFIVVDNRSTDGVRDLLADRPDVSLFAADGDFKQARFATDWINGLLRRYCVGKWVLWLDADELLVFSDRGGADLRELTGRLRSRAQDSLQTLMLDMYSACPPEQNVVAPGVDPRTVCDLYDRSGYVRNGSAATGIAWIKGGVRGRLFFTDPWAGPALNKTPLVRWRRHYAFLKVTHQLWPQRLNGGDRVEGILLHFKFTATAAQKMVDSALRLQHTAEYDAYDGVGRVSFVDDQVTGKLVDNRSLVDDGLFTPVV